MKIDEPKTPYTGYSDSEEESDGRNSRRRVSLVGAVDPVQLSESLETSIKKGFSPRAQSSDLDDEEVLTPEQIGRLICMLVLDGLFFFLE